MCSPFIENTDIFFNNSLGDKKINELARAGIGYLSNSTTVSQQVSKCVEVAKAFVCHSLYPYCDPTSLGTRSPRPICQRTCEAIINGTCQVVLNVLPDSLKRILLSNCDTVEKEGGDMPECIHISLEAPQKLGEQCSHFLSCDILVHYVCYVIGYETKRAVNI